MATHIFPNPVTTTAVVTAEGVRLPSEFMQTYSLAPGNKVLITIEKECRPSPAELDRLIDETCGMFAGGPSMTDELLKERREEDLRSEW